MENQKQPHEKLPSPEEKPEPIVRVPAPLPKGSKETPPRVSNRRYAVKNCQKSDCNAEFIPTDSRHKYCCRQHRIDYQNDKRKEEVKIHNDFANKVKKNKAILAKIFNSNEYQKWNRIHVDVLKYEDYDFRVYHNTMIQEFTKRELKICFDHAIMLIDSEKQFYQILNQGNYEF